MRKAVITGDIVNFTTLKSEEREALVRDSKEMLHILSPQKGDAELFRGDSFQLIVDTLSDALFKSIQLRCWFKKVQSRRQKVSLDAKIAIGVGGISYFGDSVLDSDGEAFHLSGRTFDKMEDELLRIVVPDEKLNKQLEIIADLMNVIITDWTKAQAEVIYMLLERKTQQQIAEIIGIAQSAVNNRIKLAKWKEIERTVNYISSLIDG
jgi:hypothetical protein